MEKDLREAILKKKLMRGTASSDDNSAEDYDLIIREGKVIKRTPYVSDKEVKAAIEISKSFAQDKEKRKQLEDQQKMRLQKEEPMADRQVQGILTGNTDFKGKKEFEDIINRFKEMHINKQPVSTPYADDDDRLEQLIDDIRLEEFRRSGLRNKAFKEFEDELIQKEIEKNPKKFEGISLEDPKVKEYLMRKILRGR